MKNAFMPETITAGAISATAQFVAENGGDVRLGLDCILRAGQNSDDRIDVPQIRPFLVSAKNMQLKDRLKGLPETHVALLKTIANITMEGGSTVSGEVFKKHSETQEDYSERTYRKHISELEDLGLVSTENTGVGFRGRSRIINLRAPAELVLTLTE